MGCISSNTIMRSSKYSRRYSLCIINTRTEKALNGKPIIQLLSIFQANAKKSFFFLQKNRFEIPLLVEYLELVLRSRQAPKVLFRWLLLHSQGRTRKERKEERSKAVMTLLSITPSAIHIRYLQTPPPNLFQAFANPPPSKQPIDLYGDSC